LPITNPALVDEDLVAALETHAETNQLGVPENFAGLRAFDDRLGDMFSN
jgi:hypothetical protein